MDVLSKLENALERAVEGAFARTFRARLHPVEIAKRLAREMDAHRTASVSAAYMPNRFQVGLSARDCAEFEHVREAVLPEIAAYLTEHARRARCALAGAVEIMVEADDSLSPGEMRVESSLAAAAQGVAFPPPLQQPVLGNDAERVVPQARLIAEDGGETPLDQAVTRIGRAPDSDLVLSDRAVSRRHAEIHRRGNEFTLLDARSKNGTYCNGQRIESASIHDGDRIQVGSITLVFRVR